MGKFGVARKDAPESDSDGMYLRSFKKGETLVRFLEEVDTWIFFREHYNEKGRAFPCTNDRDTCPGCTSDDERVSKSTRKYATNVLVLRDDHKDYVAPYRVPIGLAESMFGKSERNHGTILDRDFLVMRTGSSLQTNYEVDPDDKYELDTRKWRKDMVDIEEVLQAMFDENAPEPGSGRRRSRDDEDEPRGRSRSRGGDESRSRSRSRGDDSPRSRGEDDEPRGRSRSRDDEDEPRSRRREPEPDDEPEVKSKAKDDEEDIPQWEKENPVVRSTPPDVIDEDALYDMKPDELLALANKHNIDVGDAEKKSELISAIMKASAK